MNRKIRGPIMNVSTWARRLRQACGRLTDGCGQLQDEIKNLILAQVS